MIVVTGTRLPRPALDAAVPVFSLDERLIEGSGETDIAGILNELPALIGSTVNDTAGDAAGVDSLNLRNLGTNRTLTLINGRRQVGAIPGSVEVDTNTIPLALIERVDIVTGGASAIYGADAVSGVVNFVLRRDFEGVAVQAQAGITDNGDAEEFFGSVTAGRNFKLAGRNLNVAANYTFRDVDGLLFTDRDFASSGFANLVSNPEEEAEPGDDPNIPDFAFFRDVTFPFTSGRGLVDTGVGQFLGDGTPFDPGLIVDGGRNAIGGGGTRLADLNGSLTPDERQQIFNLNLNYEVNRAFRPFIEAKYARTNTRAFGSPSFGDLLPISLDNAFLAQSGIPIEGAFGTDFVFVSQDYFSLGLRGNENLRETWRIVAGASGDLPANLSYEIYYNHGVTTLDAVSLNNRIEDRFIAASDAVVDPATGQIVCRSNLDPTAVPPAFFNDSSTGAPSFLAFPTTFNADLFGTSFTPGANSGCAPFDVFGNTPPSAAALAFINDQSLTTGRLRQQVVSGFLRGDTSGWFALPGGPARFAVGGEWRDELSENFPPLINQQGLTFGNVTQDTVGSFDVVEGFAEIELPLLADRPFVKELTISGAARVSDYSTVGTTVAWQANGRWSPISGLAFRGGYSSAVRAPNIAELFTPQQQGFFLPDDPCDVDFVDQGTPFRAVNCAAALNALGIDPATFNPVLGGTFPGIVQGNPDLSEETARTYSAGVVVTPALVPGLRLSADYYRVRIENGILNPAAQDIVEACFDAPTLDNQFCGLIGRDPTTGELNTLTTQAVNVASFETAGLDYSIAYDVPLDRINRPGDLTFVINGGWLQRLDLVEAPNGLVDDDVGEAGTELGGNAPEFIVNFDVFYRFKRFSVNYQYRWQDGTLRVEREDLAVDPDLQFPVRFRDVNSHDIQFRYQFTKGLEAYAGINNLTGQRPDVGSLGLPGGLRGRFFFVGVNYRFGG